MSSFFVSHFESSPESFGIQSDSVWFWSRLFCVCLGLNKRVESHQVMITVYETDKRKRYKEIFKRSLVPLLSSLFIPYENAKRESLFVKERACACACVCVRVHVRGVCARELLQYCGLYCTTVWAFNLYICYLIMLCLYSMCTFETFLWHFPLIFSGSVGGRMAVCQGCGGGMRGCDCVWVVACEGARSVTSSKDPSSSEPVILWNNLALM